MPTGRALALAGAGVAALLASRGFGTPALATLGAGLVALPVLVTTLVWAAARGLRIERAVAPARCRAGDEVRVGVRRGGWPARCGLDRLLDVAIDPGLGTLGGGVGARREGDVWRVRAVRGDHRLPAPRATVADPFGLARAGRRGAGDGELLAVPAAPAIARVPRGRPAPGRAARRRRAAPGFGELERVRAHEPGDPLSRIHWGQTAKRGRLQTKELRAPEGSGRSTLILLDGAVAAGPDLEAAVEAAAALARHLLEAGEAVTLVHTGRAPARIPPARARWPAVEVALARVEGGGARSTALALSAELSGPDAPDAAVVVTGAADAGLASAVARARGSGVGVAVVLAGAAGAAAPELAAVGAEVVVVPGPGEVAAALSRPAPDVAAAR